MPRKTTKETREASSLVEKTRRALRAAGDREQVDLSEEVSMITKARHASPGACFDLITEVSKTLEDIEDLYSADLSDEKAIVGKLQDVLTYARELETGEKA